MPLAADFDVKFCAYVGKKYCHDGVFIKPNSYLRQGTNFPVIYEEGDMSGIYILAG